MSPELPPALRDAVARELEGVSRKDLAPRAERTSQAYRAGRGSAGVIQSREDALAYALVRLPATYAACATVLEALQAEAPGFAPRSLLDAGCGTGAASWAAAEAFDLERAIWLDASAPFLDLAGRLAAEGPAALRVPEVRRLDLAAGGPWPTADLIMASYALAEIAPEAQGRVVTDLWGSCSGAIVLVEPGTPAGFQRILVAREILIAADAQILAPCPHARACPLAAPDWCHFSVRLPRSRDHQLAKGAEVPFEDEKFAYVVAARPGVASGPRAARVLRPPRVGKAGIEFRLCAPQGLQTRTVTKREKPAHAKARRLGWGDRFDLG